MPCSFPWMNPCTLGCLVRISNVRDDLESMACVVFQFFLGNRHAKSVSSAFDSETNHGTLRSSSTVILSFSDSPLSPFFNYGYPDIENLCLVIITIIILRAP